MLQKIDECVVFKVLVVRSDNTNISTITISFSIEIQLHVGLQLMVSRGIEPLLKLMTKFYPARLTIAVALALGHPLRERLESAPPMSLYQVYTFSTFDVVEI